MNAPGSHTSFATTYLQKYPVAYGFSIKNSTRVHTIRVIPLGLSLKYDTVQTKILKHLKACECMEEKPMAMTAADQCVCAGYPTH